MPELKKHFTQTFRDEAVRLVQTSSRSGREIAEDLGGGLSTLCNWIDVRRRRAMDESPPDRHEDMAAELSLPVGSGVPTNAIHAYCAAACRFLVWKGQ